MTTPQGGTPVWAQSVSAFTSAISQSSVYTTATPIQFPDTGQLSGVCGGLLSGSAMTNGLMTNGDPATNGPAGALVPGTQGFSDTLCGLMGGAGVNTTPQSIVSGATDVSNAVNGTPLAAGTMAMAAGAPTGNSALDAINGSQALANSLYPSLSGCGCGEENSPANLTPTQIQANATQLSTAYGNSAMASGIVGLGQATNGNSGNVAIDAINGGQAFANTMYGITSLCGICNIGGVGSPEFTGSLIDSVANNLGGAFGVSVSPTDIIDVAQAIADAVTSSPYIGTIQSVIGSSGNIGIDAVSGLGTSTAVNNSQHVSHVSLTTAQSVNLLDQNLLVSDDFATASTVMSDTHWSWNATAGSAAVGAAECVCNGTQNDMVSCEIPVVVDENIEIAAEIRWTGLTYTGTTQIAVGVQMYRQTTTAAGTVFLDVGGYDVATVTSPTSTGPSVGINTSTGADGHIWLGVAGTFVVPAGVDQLRLRLRVYDTVTAGTVFFDDGEMLKTDLIASECVPGVGETVDSIVTQLYGVTGAGFTQNQAAVALGNTASALSSASAKIAQLAAESGTGSIAGDDFNWSGIFLGPGSSSNWSGFYNPALNSPFPPAFDSGNYYQANGSLALYTPPGILEGPMDFKVIWAGTDSVSTTDYQVIQMVLNSSPISSLGFPPDQQASYIDLVGRSNTSLTNFTVARFGSDGTVAVGYFSSGSYIWIWTGTCIVPGQATTLTLYCGSKSSTDIWNFRLQINDLVIVNFDDTAHTSPMGATNRCWGWGAYAPANNIYQGTPPSVQQWVALDQ